MTQVRANEGQRALRNAASFGTFLFSPLHMAVLSRALGQAGYGRWWSSFVVLEAASILGMLGAELFVRRELPRLLRERAGEEEIHAVIGSAIAVVLIAGLAILGLQLALVGAIVDAQHDPALAPFLLVLSAQPILWNVTSVLAAGLQSRDVMGPVAVLRGLIMPLVLAGTLACAWRARLPTGTTLVLLVLQSLVALLGMVAIYARHFSLRRTFANIIALRKARSVARFGFGLLLSAVLITAMGKVDLYVLGGEVSPAEVGIYAACLQMAAMLPNTRAIFDPISQAQIGALHASEHAELAGSLRRLARMCALAMAPSFVLVVAVGQPIMEWLLGHPVDSAVVPLAILCLGQLVGNVAVSAWLVSMTMPGHVLAAVCAITLAVKLALLMLLVPSYGLVGAAIATAVGTIIPMQLQAWLGARKLGERVYSAGILPVFAVTVVLATGGRALYAARVQEAGALGAAVVAGGGAVLAIVIALPFLLTATERRGLRDRLRRRT